MKKTSKKQHNRKRGNKMRIVWWIIISLVGGFGVSTLSRSGWDPFWLVVGGMVIFAIANTFFDIVEDYYKNKKEAAASGR